MKKILLTVQMHVHWFIRTWNLLSNWPQMFLQKFRISAFSGDTYLKLRQGPVYVADKRGWGIDDLTAVWSDKVYGDLGEIANIADPVVIDVGAHIGTYAVYAALKAPRARIFALEPNPAVFTYLQKSVAANALESRIVCIEKAVANSSSERLLFLDEGGGVSSSLFKRAGRDLNEGISVPCMTMKELFDAYGIERCSILKMNCEGAEYEILGGLTDEMFSKIDSVLLQWHRVESHQPEELDVLLAQKGFKVSRAPVPYKFIYARR